jgi:ankyrin repeat protein
VVEALLSAGAAMLAELSSNDAVNDVLHRHKADKTNAPSFETTNAFVDAVRRVEVEQVRLLLAQNPSLVHARILGDSRMLGEMQARENSNTISPPVEQRTCTALHFAARFGHDGLAKYLLEHGANANGLGWTGDEECTPLDLAAWEGTLPCVQMLLEHGADPNQSARRSCSGSSALYTAAEHGRQDVCELLLRFGAHTDIHSAAMLGLVDGLSRLLEADAALINARDFRRRTPLDCALSFGQAKAAEFLIQRGAAVNLLQAAGMGMLDRVRQFVEADPRAVNPADGDETPLMAAARNGRLEVMKFLLEHGADVHLGQTEHVHTIQPIHVASAPAVALLAAAGADLNQPYRGYTPLQRAFSKGDQGLALLIARHGGKRRFYLVGHLHVELVEPLINLGAEVNETDEHGRTALDYALANQKRAAADFPAASKRYAALADSLLSFFLRINKMPFCQATPLIRNI